MQTSAQRYKFNLQKHDVRPYHFGFILAATSMDFSIATDPDQIGLVYENIPGWAGEPGSLYSVNSSSKIGFTVGIVGNYKLAQHFDLRFVPSLAFGERKLNFTFNKNPMGIEPLFVYDHQTINSTFVEFPIHIKYKSNRAKNFRAYVLAGLKYSIDISDPYYELNTKTETGFELETYDLLYEVGVGFDFYFPFFKFGIELKSSFGTKELLIPRDNIYNDGIQSLKSKLFQISLTFE